MNAHDEERTKKLLQQAVPPVDADAEPGHQLWPAMLRRLNVESAARQSPSWAWFNANWFDGVLALGLAGLVMLFPSSIPLLLYYL